MAEPKRFPTDFRTDDSWISDKGPHYCELCGYDVVNRTPEGAERPISFDAKYFAHLPRMKWHPECADKDPRIQAAQRAMNDARHAIFSS
jgi:hypothetical protein